MPKRKAPATIKEIATALGVAKSTVSRALRDHPDISDEMKRKVKAIAKRLHYRPNAVAMSFRYRESKLIGLIVPTISHFFFPSVIQAIEKEVHDRGYHLLILQSNESYEREMQNMEILIANNVEGILVSVARETRSWGHFREALDLDIPLVFFDRVPEGLPADKIMLDDTKGAYRAVAHLIESGKKRIAICLGNPNLLISKNRLKGYRQAYEDFGLEADAQLIVEAMSSEEAEAAVYDLLQLPEPPDGLLAISDLTMAGAMQAIYAAKMHIPEQIGIIGFCESPFDTMYKPPLSVVMPMGTEIGEKAAQRLFIRINEDEESEPETILINGKLLPRKSS